MEVLTNFGVNGYLLGAQILNFLIVFYILKRLLYKPVLNMLKKRENEVKEGLRLAEEGRKTFEESSIKEREILKKASEEADKIVANAKTQALEISKQIDSEAKIRADKTLQHAHEKIEIDIKEAEEKLTRQIGRIALGILQRTLPQILNKKDQEEILKKAASHIK